MTSPSRYFHTIRYLKPSQTLGRILYRLRQPRVPSPTESASTKPRSIAYAEPVRGAQSLLAPNVFRLLNVERTCNTAVDWNAVGVPKLWLYNLHYFADLNAVDSPQRAKWHRDLLQRWIVENPAPRGVGWEPFPTSLRIVNWIKWALGGNDLPAGCLASLSVQANWLASRIEYHIQGNHLIANAKALLHAGLFLDIPQASRLFDLGFELMTRQLREQVLEDGGHYERSAMYHAFIMEDLLDLNNLFRCYQRQWPGDWQAALERMRAWLRVMTHPDGGTAFFNDASFGIAPTEEQLKRYAQRLGFAPTADAREPITHLRSSGYVRVLRDDAFLLCDCAPVGPDHQPGHAHADTLSLEFDLGTERIFVNSGTSEYGAGPERQRQRGTAAHTTVLVDGKDSSEVWGGFRVARRARVRIQQATFDERSGTVEVTASHDGYCRLSGHVEHKRTWTMRSGALVIADVLSGRFGTADARFHLHPNIQVELRDTTALLTAQSGRRLRVSFDGGVDVRVDKGTWHPEFGIAIENRCVNARFSGSTLTTRVEWDSHS